MVAKPQYLITLTHTALETTPFTY